MISPRSVPTVTRSPSAAPISRRWPSTAARPPCVRFRPGAVHHPAAGPRRAACASPPGRPGPGAGAATARSGTTAARGTHPGPQADAGQLLGGVRCRPQAEVDADLVGQEAQHPQIRDCAGVQRGFEGPNSALPVDERAALLDHGCHREHHVGPLGDRALAQFQAHDERRRVDCGKRGVRVGQVGELDTADQQRTQFAVARRRQDRRRCRGPRGRACRRRSRPRRLSRAVASPPGAHRATGSAAHRPPARRVPRPAAGPRRAGRRSRPPAVPRPRTRRGRWPAARRPG